MEDIVDVREEITREISAALRRELSPADEARLARREIDNAEAYQLYSRSRYHSRKTTAEGLAMGFAYAQQAIALGARWTERSSSIPTTRVRDELRANSRLEADTFAFERANESGNGRLRVSLVWIRSRRRYRMGAAQEARRHEAIKNESTQTN